MTTGDYGLQDNPVRTGPKPKASCILKEMGKGIGGDLLAAPQLIARGMRAAGRAALRGAKAARATPGAIKASAGWVWTHRNTLLFPLLFISIVFAPFVLFGIFFLWTGITPVPFGMEPLWASNTIFFGCLSWILGFYFLLRYIVAEETCEQRMKGAGGP